jgi:hypothetical protein
MSQNRGLQPLNLQARIHSKLLAKQSTETSIGDERVALATIAIQRQHQQRPPAFSQRLVGDHRLQLGNRLMVTAQRQHGRHSIFGRRRPQLVKPDRLASGKGQLDEFSQALSPPQPKSLIKHIDRGPVLPHFGGPPGLRDQTLRLRRVGDAVEPVARRPSHDRAARTFTQRPPKPQHVVLKSLRSGTRRVAVPQRVNQSIVGDDFPRMHSKNRKKTTFLCPTQRRHALRPDQLQRAEHSHTRRHEISVARDHQSVQSPIGAGLPTESALPSPPGQHGNPSRSLCRQMRRCSCWVIRP